MTVCPPCLAYLGTELAAEIGDCHRHTVIVQALAREFAVVCQSPTPTDEQVGYFIEDATEVAEGWPDDTELHFEDRGIQDDSRRHYVINGERWAEPPPDAEGFNTVEPMARCDHSGGDLGPDDECEDCNGSGWVPQWLADERS